MTSQTINKEAPGVGQDAEGGNQKPSQDSVESKATRHARAAAARPGSIASDRKLIIEDSPATEVSVVLPTGRASRRHARLAASELRALPLVIHQTSAAKRARVWRTPDGTWWRQGGAVRIQRWPDAESERAFVLFVHKGSNSDDVKYLLRVIESARRGEDFDLLWDPVTAEWADELTFVSRMSRRYDDPYSHRDTSPRAIVCTDSMCRELWHAGVAAHVVDSAEGPGYSITVCRYAAEKNWHIDVDTSGTEFTPKDVEGYVNDLRWMIAECERANAEGVTQSVGGVEIHHPTPTRELRRPAEVDERIREQE